jgi:hypothetical protein
VARSCITDAIAASPRARADDDGAGTAMLPPAAELALGDGASDADGAGAYDLATVAALIATSPETGRA